MISGFSVTASSSLSAINTRRFADWVALYSSNSSSSMLTGSSRRTYMPVLRGGTAIRGSFARIFLVAVHHFLNFAASPITCNRMLSTSVALVAPLGYCLSTSTTRSACWLDTISSTASGSVSFRASKCSGGSTCIVMTQKPGSIRWPSLPSKSIISFELAASYSFIWPKPQLWWIQ